MKIYPHNSVYINIQWSTSSNTFRLQLSIYSWKLKNTLFLFISLNFLTQTILWNVWNIMWYPFVLRGNLVFSGYMSTALPCPLELKRSASTETLYPLCLGHTLLAPSGYGSWGCWWCQGNGRGRYGKLWGTGRGASYWPPL